MVACDWELGWFSGECWLCAMGYERSCCCCCPEKHEMTGECKEVQWEWSLGSEVGHGKNQTTLVDVMCMMSVPGTPVKISER